MQDENETKLLPMSRKYSKLKTYLCLKESELEE